MNINLPRDMDSDEYQDSSVVDLTLSVQQDCVTRAIDSLLQMIEPQMYCGLDSHVKVILEDIVIQLIILKDLYLDKTNEHAVEEEV